MQESVTSLVASIAHTNLSVLQPLLHQKVLLPLPTYPLPAPVSIQAGTSDWWSLHHDHTLPDRETGKEYLTCSASTIEGGHCLPPKVIIYSLGNFRNVLQLKGFRCYWKVKKIIIPFLPHSFIFFQSLFFPFLLVELKKLSTLVFISSYPILPNLALFLKSHHIPKSSRHFSAHAV